MEKQKAELMMQQALMQAAAGQPQMVQPGQLMAQGHYGPGPHFPTEQGILSTSVAVPLLWCGRASLEPP